MAVRILCKLGQANFRSRKRAKVRTDPRWDPAGKVAQTVRKWALVGGRAAQDSGRVVRGGQDLGPMALAALDLDREAQMAQNSDPVVVRAARECGKVAIVIEADRAWAKAAAVASADRAWAKVAIAVKVDPAWGQVAAKADPAWDPVVVAARAGQEWAKAAGAKADRAWAPAAAAAKAAPAWDPAAVVAKADRAWDPVVVAARAVPEWAPVERGPSRDQEQGEGSLVPNL
ncbi:MAG: hypothetical protein PHE55_14360 [Methylococcaceae bacterium]|nr:hypothetical protein [Methylococcaceae bacterium]